MSTYKTIACRVNGVYTECKVKGEIVRIDKGEWSNTLQDWFAVLTFDSGVKVESSLLFKDFK